MIATPALNLLLLAAFSALLGTGAWYDVRARRVPNALVLVLFGMALVASVLRTGDLLVGPWAAMISALLGLLCWLPWWLLGMLGAGDVKFFAASAAWLTPALTWRATLVAALLGGLISLLMLRRHAARTPSSTVPYAVPMAVALALACWTPWLLYLL